MQATARVRPLGIIVLAVAASLAGGRGAARAQADSDAATHRFEAPIAVETAAPVVRLVVPAAVLARSASPRHADLRVVDAAGARVPFARLPADRRTRADERARDAVPYPLPARPSPDGTWPVPVAIAIDGDRVRVRRGGPPPSEPPGRSAGWLVDTGARTADVPAAESLVVAWSGPAEFTAGYRLQTSDDLRTWRDGEPGQLLQLASPAGTLVQATVPLPSSAQRYARLVWTDPAAPVPTVTGVRAVAPVRLVDGTTAPAAEVAVPARAVAAETSGGLSEADARRTLVFDLEGPLPVDAVRLRLPPGEARLLPVRIEGRESPRVAWRPLGTAVFRTGSDGGDTPESRLQDVAGGAAGLPLRQIRLVVDPRVAMPAAAGVALDARLALPELVFAPTGAPPFRLQTGDADASDGALPLAMLVPERPVDRARLGRASVGPVAENAEAARAAERAARLAAVRPWALWALLLVGVAGLAAMVWRLAKAPRGETPETPAA